MWSLNPEVEMIPKLRSWNKSTVTFSKCLYSELSARRSWALHLKVPPEDAIKYWESAVCLEGTLGRGAPAGLTFLGEARFHCLWAARPGALVSVWLLAGISLWSFPQGFDSPWEDSRHGNRFPSKETNTVNRVKLILSETVHCSSPLVSLYGDGVTASR